MLFLSARAARVYLAYLRRRRRGALCCSLLVLLVEGRKVERGERLYTMVSLDCAFRRRIGSVDRDLGTYITTSHVVLSVRLDPVQTQSVEEGGKALNKSAFDNHR